MFANLLEKIKSPVTTMIEKSQEEDLKKSGIKLAIVSVVMALISTISSIISIFSKYSKRAIGIVIIQVLNYGTKDGML